jgi:uncharacterized phage-associated protein
MITFTFDIKKAVQIINHLLGRNRGTINYTKLIKLLYIADREYLSLYDATITGDKYVSMENGPVLSEIYNLIMGRTTNKHDQLYWDGFFCRNAYDLTKVHDNRLPTDALSPAEIEILDTIQARFKRKNYSKMIEYVHNKDLFPEVKWEEARQSSLPLAVEDILRNLGRSEEEINAIEKETAIQKNEAAIISECCV